MIYWSVFIALPPQPEIPRLPRDEVNAISMTVSKPEQAFASAAGSECDCK
jgi:hypothetical protein